MNSTPSSKKPVQLWITAALSLGGLTLASLLTTHFYEMRNGTASFKSMCNMGQSMNCDAVAASKFAELFSGLPLSSFAAGWYVALFVISLLAFLPDWRRTGIKALMIFSGIGLIFSLVYLAVMVSVLKTYCLYCFGIDGINVLLLVLALSLKSQSKGSASGESSQWKTVLALLAGSLFVVVVLLKGTQSVSVDSNQVDEMVNSIMNSAPVSVNTDSSFPSMGAQNAPITLVEFSDFQCPYCRLGAISLNTLINRYPGKVRVVFRNFPLDPTCNRKVEHSMHAYACEAAKVGHCSFEQGKFEAVYQELFENQESFGKTRPAQLAQGAGVDSAKLDACVNSPETNTAITKDVEEGVTLGIESTPTFYINGHKVMGLLPLQAWDALIAKLAP